MQKNFALGKDFDNLKKFRGGLPEEFWRLELTDALIGNKVVSCLYLFHGYDGYDVILLNFVCRAVAAVVSARQGHNEETRGYDEQSRDLGLQGPLP